MFCKRWCECRPKTSGTLAFLLVTSSSVNPSDCRAFSSIFSSNSVRWPFSPRVPVALTAYFRRRERGAVRDATYKQVNAQAAVIFRTRTEQNSHHTFTYARTFMFVANVVRNPALVKFFLSNLRFRFFRGAFVVLDSLF